MSEEKSGEGAKKKKKKKKNVRAREAAREWLKRSSRAI